MLRPPQALALGCVFGSALVFLLLKCQAQLGLQHYSAAMDSTTFPKSTSGGVSWSGTIVVPITIQTLGTAPTTCPQNPAGSIDSHGKTQCNPCTQLQPLMEALKTMGKSTESQQLFVVPLDWLISHKESPSTYLSLLDEFVANLARNWDYLRFGGSDHIFLCLSRGCGTIMMDIIKRYNLGKDTRAMWVGSEKENALISDQWACPDRVLTAPESLLQILGFSGDVGSGETCGAATTKQISTELNSVVETAWSKIRGRDRWACSGDRWRVDLSSMKGQHHQGCILVPKHKMCVSGIPKCGSSTMNVLLRRMNGIKRWNDSHGKVHGAGNGLHWVNASKNFTKYQQIMLDPKWVKVTVLREPASRVLSAYLDKIVKLREFGRIAYKGKTVPSFNSVLDHFLEVTKAGRMRLTDLHFRPLSEFASLRVVRYDFVARIESLATDLEILLTSLGLWDDFGASGWGENGDLSFAQVKGWNKGVMGESNHITNETLTKIFKIYEEDYTRFAFSIQDKWGLDPSKLSSD